jgi:hypothetical protein
VSPKLALFNPDKKKIICVCGNYTDFSSVKNIVVPPKFLGLKEEKEIEKFSGLLNG